jgi:SAM-dependent methyltransferase
MAIDPAKLDRFMSQVFADLGATFHATLIVIGDKLGLYRALAEGGPQTPAQLARRTNTAERYIREWLAAQAASGYAHYNAASGHYSLDDEQAFALADESSPAFVPGGFQVALAASRAQEKLLDAFRTGQGVGWHDHHADLFAGTERFFRPGYAAHLVAEWIPALEGVEEKLRAGARVADVGCGLGASTRLLAKAYPRSTFFGFDYHPTSIVRAQEMAQQDGVDDRTRFAVARAQEYPGEGYDLVTFFDCLHDMGDPVGAGSHVLKTLATDGCWMIVEPFAHDRVEQNLNPIGRVMYSASTQICTPASLSQELGLALGAQAGEARIREVVTASGFTQFRRATETPVNLVFEARP